MTFKSKVLNLLEDNEFKLSTIDAVQDDIEVQVMHFDSVQHMMNYFRKGACFNLYVYDIVRTEESVQFWGIA